jgi:hypothetical protein
MARGRLLALSLTLLGTVAGCATTPDDDVARESDALTEVSARDAVILAGQLRLLATTVDQEELDGAEADRVVATLRAEMPSRKDFADMGLDGEADELLPRATRRTFRVYLAGGRTALVASLRWDDPRAKGSYTAVTLVAPAGESAFSFAERITSGVDGGSKVELFRLDNRHSTRVHSKSVEASAESMPGELAVVANQIAPQALSSTGRRFWCNTCAWTIRGVWAAGVIASRVAGTSGATWICARIGFQAGVATAATGVGAVAAPVAGLGTMATCMGVISWLGTITTAGSILAVAPDNEMTTSLCNQASNFLGQGDVCVNQGALACSPEEFASRKNDPVQRCTQFGICARAANCEIESAAICSATCSQEGGHGERRTEEQRKKQAECIDLCSEITNRTCNKAAPLFDREQMVPECKAYLTP